MFGSLSTPVSQTRSGTWPRYNATAYSLLHPDTPTPTPISFSLPSRNPFTHQAVSSNSSGSLDSLVHTSPSTSANTTHSSTNANISTSAKNTTKLAIDHSLLTTPTPTGSPSSLSPLSSYSSSSPILETPFTSRFHFSHAKVSSSAPSQSSHSTKANHQPEHHTSIRLGEHCNGHHHGRAHPVGPTLTDTQASAQLSISLLSPSPCPPVPACLIPLPPTTMQVYQPTSGAGVTYGITGGMILDCDRHQRHHGNRGNYNSHMNEQCNHDSHSVHNGHSSYRGHNGHNGQSGHMQSSCVISSQDDVFRSSQPLPLHPNSSHRTTSGSGSSTGTILPPVPACAGAASSSSASAPSIHVKTSSSSSSSRPALRATLSHNAVVHTHNYTHTPANTPPPPPWQLQDTTHSHRHHPMPHPNTSHSPALDTSSYLERPHSSALTLSAVSNTNNVASAPVPAIVSTLASTPASASTPAPALGITSSSSVPATTSTTSASNTPYAAPPPAPDLEHHSSLSVRSHLSSSSAPSQQHFDSSYSFVPYSDDLSSYPSAATTATCTHTPFESLTTNTATSAHPGPTAYTVPQQSWYPQPVEISHSHSHPFPLQHPYSTYTYHILPHMQQGHKQVEPILAPGELPAPRPPASYAALIGEALLLAPIPHQLYVSEISDSIKKRYAYYRQNPSKIYNGVRHQTSMCKAFVKLPRPFGDQSGGARKWAIRAGCESWFAGGGYHPPAPTSPTPSSKTKNGGKAKATARAKQLAIGTDSPRRALKDMGPPSPYPTSAGPSSGPAWDPSRTPHPYPHLGVGPTSGLTHAAAQTVSAATQANTNHYQSLLPPAYHYLPSNNHQQSMYVPVSSWGGYAQQQQQQPQPIHHGIAGVHSMQGMNTGMHGVHGVQVHSGGAGQQHHGSVTHYAAPAPPHDLPSPESPWRASIQHGMGMGGGPFDARGRGHTMSTDGSHHSPPEYRLAAASNNAGSIHPGQGVVSDYPMHGASPLSTHLSSHGASPRDE